jgi:osmoprotectant transport system permease protein
MSAMGVFDLPSYVQPASMIGLIDEQLKISLGACAVGLAVALPLGRICARWRWVYPPVLATATALYAIPSIAFFVFLIAYTRLTDTTIFIPLAVYSLVVLVPGVVDGLRSVPPEVRLSADAMGFGPIRRYLTVELPVAAPIIIAAVRVATVSSLSLMSVGALIGSGKGGLGQLFSLGQTFHYPRLIWLGLVTIAALAVVCDVALLGLQRVLTPWAPRRSKTR